MITKRGVVILACAWVCAGIGRPSAENALKDAFLHQGPKIENSLELGKLVLYFSDRADFTLLPLTEAPSIHKSQKSYFFPQTKVVGSEVLKTIDRISRVRTAWYSVQIAVVQKPIEGVRVTITYDPEKIEVSDQFFDSIQLNKALEVIFYNKELKRRLITGAQAPLLRRAANEKKKYGVIVDCGHGGKDTGAIGYGQLQEKEVTLSVGLRLAQLLERQGITVFLTRDHDTSVPIDIRTSFANSVADEADLLVSIHANMAKNEAARGVETFCLERSLFFPLADEPDKKFAQCVSRLLDDRYMNSKLLAQQVQNNVLSCTQKKNGATCDRQVKQAVAQILLGTQLPAALVEVGFLSNKHEALLLRTKSYQQALANGICNGILAYLREIA